MALHLGPILTLRSTTANTWAVSALVVVDSAPPVLNFSYGDTKRAAPEPVTLLEHNGWVVLRYVMNVTQEARALTVSYGLTKIGNWKFVVPAKDAAPHVLFASCNGFSDPKYMKQVKQRNFLWSDVARRHRRKPFHLMVLGGDQVYADAIWHEKEVPLLHKWVEKGWGARVNARFTGPMKKAVEEFYFRLYCNRWRQKEPARMFETIPSIMMWDDHEIFDGWGSYPDDMQNSSVYQGIYKIARRHFMAFQLHEGPNPSGKPFLAWPENFSSFLRAGPIGILVLDLRSERNIKTVMGAKSWASIETLLDSKDAKGLKHLLVVSSIPVVHTDFSILETIFDLIPCQQELEDDLRDRWHSKPHKIERLKMIKLLLDFGKKQRTRVTFLSGDVHLAAVGAIENRRYGSTGDNADVINQLTSSAIVHPPPPSPIVWLLNLLGTSDEDVDRDIRARMLYFRGTRYSFVGRRNWLELTYDRNAGSVLAEWRTEQNTGSPEDGIEKFSKVINCCS